MKMIVKGISVYLAAGNDVLDRNLTDRFFIQQLPERIYNDIFRAVQINLSSFSK